MNIKLRADLHCPPARGTAVRAEMSLTTLLAILLMGFQYEPFGVASGRIVKISSYNLMIL